MENTEERRNWFQTFVPLYEKAAPIIRRISNLDTLIAGELPVSPYSLVESNPTIKLTMDAVRKIPKPREKELAGIQREFELALSNCVKAAETATKYIGPRQHDRDNQALLNATVNLMMSAREHLESVSKRLTPYG